MTYRDFHPDDIEYVLVKTTDQGPWVEDAFFLILSKKGAWEVPNSAGQDVLDWLKTFPHVNFEKVIASMGCAENRLFILYRGSGFPVLSEAHKKALKERLLNFLAGHFEGSPDGLGKVAANLFDSYKESSRFYHNLEHIQHCLRELDRIPDPAIHRPAIELAIWYHDAVYSPKSKKNEQKSAALLLTDLSRLKSSLPLSDVQQMILSPFLRRPLSLDEQYFSDIDFSILGQREIEYSVYVQNIRLEYESVPSWLFRFKRRAFLKALLTKPIFHTAWFQGLYEHQAHKNLKSELS